MASIASEEDLVNVALARIGAKSISDLDNDTTAEAVEARRVYYNLRDRLMRAHPWNFLTKRAALSDSGADPVFGWDEGFALPNDFLRIISVHATDDNDDQPPYKLEKQDISSTMTDVLLINSSTCYLRYVYKETDPTKWITDFQDAVAWELAAELSLVLPVSGTGYDRLHNRAMDALAAARSIDGMEDWPERFPEGSWVTDRNKENEWGDW